jgi:hypothetical protein
MGNSSKEKFEKGWKHPWILEGVYNSDNLYQAIDILWLSTN